MNHVTLIGRVGQDPEIKTFDDGGRIANCSLATSSRWKDKDGGRHERTEWHRLVFRAGLVSVVENYVHKGDQIAVTGEIRYREFGGKEGKIKITEIHVADLEMLGSKKDAASEKVNPNVDEFPNSPPPPEDDLPF